MAVLPGPEPVPVAEPAAEAAPPSPGPALVLAVALVRAAAWLWPEPAQAQAEALLAGPALALVAVPPLPVLAPALPEAAQPLPVPELEPASALPPAQVRRGCRRRGWLLGRLQLCRRPGWTRCRRRPGARPERRRARRHTAVCRQRRQHGLGFRRRSVAIALLVGAWLPRPTHCVGRKRQKRQC